MSALAVCALVACSATQPAPFEATHSFRSETVPIASSTSRATSDIYGEWHVRYAMQPESAPDRVTFDVWTLPGSPTSIQFDCDGIAGSDANTCPNLPTQMVDRGSRIEGRFAFAATDPATGVYTVRDYWVLWIDEGARTTAMGAPDGSFAWILDRNPTGGADRIEAARKMLAFNGYDLSQLKAKK